VGPEVIMGSTRMKAGTSQKLVLNMITTTVMIKLGKVYGNLMVDLLPTNEKLMDRAVRITAYAAGVNEETAAEYIEMSNYNPKTAIVMIKTGCSKNEAENLLQNEEHIISNAISAWEKRDKPYEG
jgi:N-acetylmuramic acid 6-phosphate etherase